MIKNLNLLVVLSLLMIACKTEKETPSGLKFKVLRKGDGTLPRSGQVIVFDYSLTDDKDSTWTNTWEEGVPAASQISDSSQIASEDGMTQMFRMLSKGDSVTASMSLGKFFRSIVRSMPPPTLDSSQILTYTVAVQDITTVEGYLEQREPKVFDRDSRNIEKFLEKNKIETMQDTSGLRYIMHSDLGGQKPKLGDCIEVKYLGRFLRNGRVFDGAESAAFPLTGDLVRGWQIALPLLGKGDSATFFIPSRLAYGQRGSSDGSIPPDAVLIFDVKLLDVKKEFDPANRTCK